MTTEEKLQSFISAGAGFTRYGDPRSQPLAAAHLVKVEDDNKKATPALWFCTLWPENEFAQHWRSFDQVEDRGHVLVFKTATGVPLFDVGALDPDELQECQWTRWTADSEEARTGRAFVRSLEVGITNSIAA